MRHLSIGLAALGTAALLLAGCAAPTDDGGGGEASDESIQLAILYGLTGPYAGYADSFFAGFDAAVEQINDDGGVLGRMIEVKKVDTRGDATFAVSALTELLDSGYRPDAIVPGVAANETLAVLPLVTEEGILAISPAVGPQLRDAESYPTFFGNSLVVEAPLEALGALMKEQGVETLGVITAADAEGDGHLSGIENVAEANGIEIVAVERPSASALNFNVEYQRILAAEPDAVHADFNSFDSLARMFEARLTVDGTDVPYFAGQSTSGSQPANLVDAAALENCLMPVFSSMVEQDDTPEFLQPLLDAYVKSPISAYAGAIGFDTVHLVALAIERSSGDTGGEALTAALLSEPIPANFLAQYPAGFEYTEDFRFPSPNDGALGLIPCDSTVVDGLWVSD